MAPKTTLTISTVPSGSRFLCPWMSLLAFELGILLAKIHNGWMEIGHFVPLGGQQDDFPVELDQTS